jgi:hypothetical protein
MCYISHVICHVPHVTCCISCVTIIFFFHLFIFLWGGGEMVEVVSGGCVPTGPVNVGSELVSVGLNEALCEQKHECW